MRELLGVAQRQEEERFLPRRVEGGVVTELDSLERQSKRLRILRVRPRRTAIDGSGELIEDDDQREPGSSPVRPVVEVPAYGMLQHRFEPLDDGSVCSAAKPPFELADHRPVIIAQMLWEPEPKNIFGLFSHQDIFHSIRHY
jgi:hypothetical protein